MVISKLNTVEWLEGKPGKFKNCATCKHNLYFIETKGNIHPACWRCLQKHSAYKVYEHLAPQEEAKS